MASFFLERCASVLVVSSTALALTGCQLLLKDKSGAGGAGSTTVATGSNATSTSKTSSGSNTTSSKSSSGAGMTSSVSASVGVSSSTGVTGCNLTGGVCLEATPFPACPQPTVSCGGDPRCDAYCTVIADKCSGGRTQYENDTQCCEVCAAVVGAPTASKASLCCRVDGLNKLANQDLACLKGGPFGTTDQAVTSNCGSQTEWTCGLLSHACNAFNMPVGCVATCTTKFGNGGPLTSYQAGDTSATLGGVMTNVMRALAAQSTGDHQSACTAAFMIACP